MLGSVNKSLNISQSLEFSPLIELDGLQPSCISFASVLQSDALTDRPW